MSDVIDEVVKVYQNKGIVTRKDVPSLDRRPFGRSLKEELEKRGCKDASYIEVALQDYNDYSGVLFDSREFTDEEAKNYMLKNVLHKEI